MSFPLPRIQAPQLPQHLLRTVECQQGAVRAVRFNGKSIIHIIILYCLYQMLAILLLFNKKCYLDILKKLKYIIIICFDGDLYTNSIEM